MAFESSPAPQGYPTILSGTLLDNRYLIKDVLGRGGLGRTYLAYDSYRFNEPCVLKEFAPIGEHDCLEKLRSLFRREGRILYELDHPQIPKFFACFEDRERLFLVQEYIEGKSYYQLLQERIKKKKAFSEIEIRQWLKDILPVLNYVHQRGIVHRDISPDNIMLPDRQQLPILIDFGVGKQLLENMDASSASTSGQNTVVGKVGYAPYEQMILGHSSPQSDLYALGVTAIVLLTGKDPNDLFDLNSWEWQWSSEVKIGKPLVKILDRLISDRPNKRYESAQVVLEEVYVESTGKISPLSSPSPKKSASTTIVPTNIKPLSNFDRHLNKDDLSLSQDFIDRCRTQLTYCIGPIAELIITEILEDYPTIRPRQFLEAIVAEIPDQQQRLALEKSLNNFRS
jgi:serine/threonine protein kinase